MPRMKVKTVGEMPNLRTLREALNLQLRPVAEAAGVDHTQLSRWERGERLMTDGQYYAVECAIVRLDAARKAST